MVCCQVGVMHQCVHNVSVWCSAVHLQCCEGSKVAGAYVHVPLCCLLVVQCPCSCKCLTCLVFSTVLYCPGSMGGRGTSFHLRWSMQCTCVLDAWVKPALVWCMDIGLWIRRCGWSVASRVSSRHMKPHKACSVCTWHCECGRCWSVCVCV